MQSGGCDVTGVLVSNQGCYITYIGIFAAAVHSWRPYLAAAEEGSCGVSRDPLNTVKVKGKGVPVHAMKAYNGSRSTALLMFKLGASWD
jgi:hypothetical protein